MEAAVRDSAERTTAAIEPLTVVSGSSQQSSLPRDAAAQFPWPSPSPDRLAPWDELARYPNFMEGHIIAGLLNNEGIPAAVGFTWPDVGLSSRSVVWVPRELMRRARWILAWAPPTDAELTFLAIGETAPPEQEDH